MSRASRACGWARRSAAAGAVLAAPTGAPAAAAGGAGRAHPGLAPRPATALRPAPAASGGTLTYHGGTIMKSSTTYAIFWRPAKLQSGAAATMSATYAPLITRYFKDVGGSGLLNSTTQYFQRVGGVTTAITNASTFGGSWTDTAPY